MQIGISLPVREMKNDLAAIREFAQTAEELGFTHLRVPDQVARPGAGQLHEPLTLLTWIAGFTSKIELVPSVIILPARETVLVASRPPRSTSSAAGDCDSASASDAAPRSSKRSARTSARAAAAATNRSSC